MRDIETWSIEKSSQLYGIDNWGSEYFRINSRGNIAVTPDGPSGPQVDLFELVKAVTARHIEPPLLVRFNGILRHRIRSIHHAFASAIKEYDYQAGFFPAYPIKVNQQRHVVDVIRQVGQEVNMGLEVGSKPELIAVLGLHENPNALLLCNGYKDRSYIELALMAKKVGRRVVITIEKQSELPLILEVAAKTGVAPEIGLRLKPSGKGAGRWEKSGGDRAKFGLTISEVVQTLQELREAGKLDIVKLIHFHIGSQLTSISSLKTALKESTQVYVQLRRQCPNLEFLDVGGGLAVDYDGSKTTFASSMNYTLEEYARDVVWTIQEICQKEGVPHPHIVTESGRATVAHHSILVFNTLGIASSFGRPAPSKDKIEGSKDPTVRNLWQLLHDLTPKNLQETLHDAMELRHETLQRFSMGLLSIEDRAASDECFWALMNAISRGTAALHYVPEDLERLPSLLTDTYFCNLSIFQSMPDNWAIQQIFPITPIHRLNEEPTERIVIGDITCDSDGTIDRFADLRDVKRFLPAHTLRNGDPYFFGAFLVGAYQEILGDMHNLFGDTNAVHVETDPEGNLEFSHVVYGDTVREVLRYVQYDREDLSERWRTALEQAVSRGVISAGESGEMYRRYVRSFDDYTYLRSDGPE